MMDINYELYKVFYHVATTLNFSEASKQLFISQSAVSQSIKTLERKLDQTLFIRSTKKVQLTPEGEILLRHIEPAMNLIQKGEAQLLDAASTGGQIRIGASDTIWLTDQERYRLSCKCRRYQDDRLRRRGSDNETYHRGFAGLTDRKKSRIRRAGNTGRFRGFPTGYPKRRSFRPPVSPE